MEVARLWGLKQVKRVGVGMSDRARYTADLMPFDFHIQPLLVNLAPTKTHLLTRLRRWRSAEALKIEVALSKSSSFMFTSGADLADWVMK